MADERYTFGQARERLEDIVAQVRKKDVSLEKSLDLLEEGVRLANTCTELSDHTEWRSAVAEARAEAGGDQDIVVEPEQARPDAPVDEVDGDAASTDSGDENETSEQDG